MNPRPPFLSIDLDYWCELDFDEAKPFLARAIAAARRSNVKMSAILSHELILDHCNAVDADCFINVDFHSDFVEFSNWKETLLARRSEGDVELNCGTWAQHVKKQNRGEFSWRYPHECCFLCSGRCDVDARAKLFTRGNETKFVSGWNKVKHRVGLPVVPRKIAGLSICLSPDWISASNLPPIAEWFIAFAKMPDVFFDERVGEASGDAAADIFSEI